MNNIYYKVLQRTPDGKLISWNTNNEAVRDPYRRGGVHIVEYTPNSPTFPKLKGSKLFCFDTFANAKGLSCKHTNHPSKPEIWIARLANPQKFKNFSPYIGDDDYILFWENPVEWAKPYGGILEGLQGTVVGSSVTLLHRVS